MQTLSQPTWVSLTGADDRTDPQALWALSQRYPRVEWALLYFPEKAGTARNPTATWRETLLQGSPLRSAAHLCGQQVFRELLDDQASKPHLAELARYSRVQVNINARQVLFSPQEVHDVYTRLLSAGLTVILQYHEASASVLDTYLQAQPRDMLQRLHVLFDGSKGKGVRPERWPAPLNVKGEALACGYAGGLGPDVLPEELPRIQEQAALSPAPYWVDMESGLRTHEVFDLVKVEDVLRLTHSL